MADNYSVLDGNSAALTKASSDLGGGVHADKQVQLASAAGGWTPSHRLIAASNNATSLKGSAGQVGGWIFANTNAAARYVKFYNKATAPDPSTDSPVYVIPVPGGTAALPTVVTMNNPTGLEFTTGIAFAVVANMSDTDNTSVSANDMSVGVLYK